MMKSVIATLILFCSLLNWTYAHKCPQALPTDDPKFCDSFKTSAICYCTASGLPSSMCSDMNLLYRRLITIFGSLQKLCEYQHDTPTQNCIDGWNCYRLGGADSHGKLCGTTGAACSV